MVESSGGSCRCTCQEEFQDSQEQSSSCCSPHVFTSILLGVLSCVLMTGGVFLAFHKWDPMWLMVSGVGVVLIIIGTILHCCHNLSQRPKRHSVGGKGCCSRPVPPDHGGHIMTNNGSLTEQLLPLSNARSVSQLSLNMLPGYFPPVVTAYGIEQHSAVVQNINRIVQQQQQQQQQPQSPGSCSPGVASTAGKSFIVLSLPTDASTANIQNLVATVYQIDGNGLTESSANEANSNATPAANLAKPCPTVPLVLKHVEVQTCNIWPTAASTSAPSTSAESSAVDILSANEITDQTVVQPTTSTVCSGTTQTDDILPNSDAINLMDCSSDIAPLCDTSTSACVNLPPDHGALVNIPTSSSPSSSTDLIDVTLPATVAIPECPSSILVDIPEPSSDHAVIPAANALVDAAGPSTDVLADPPEVLVDISVDTDSNNAVPSLEVFINNIQQGERTTENLGAAHIPPNDIVSSGTSQNAPETTNPIFESLNPELMSSNSNLSLVDTEIDDGELLERSSPPPSYEDVTLEVENGAFGLAYGTI